MVPSTGLDLNSAELVQLASLLTLDRTVLDDLHSQPIALKVCHTLIQACVHVSHRHRFDVLAGVKARLSSRLSAPLPSSACCAFLVSRATMRASLTSVLNPVQA